MSIESFTNSAFNPYQDYEIILSNRIKDLNDSELNIYGEIHESDEQKELAEKGTELNAHYIEESHKLAKQIVPLFAECQTSGPMLKGKNRSDVLDSYKIPTLIQSKFCVFGWDAEIMTAFKELQSTIASLYMREALSSHSQTMAYKNWITLRDNIITRLYNRLEIGLFPIRTQSMVDTIKEIQDGIKVDVMAGVSHLIQWIPNHPYYSLDVFYEEFHKHKAAILIPKIYKERISYLQNEHVSLYENNIAKLIPADEFFKKHADYHQKIIQDLAELSCDNERPELYSLQNPEDVFEEMSNLISYVALYSKQSRIIKVYEKMVKELTDKTHSKEDLDRFQYELSLLLIAGVYPNKKAQEAALLIQDKDIIDQFSYLQLND